MFLRIRTDLGDAEEKDSSNFLTNQKRIAPSICFCNQSKGKKETKK